MANRSETRDPPSLVAPLMALSPCAKFVEGAFFGGIPYRPSFNIRSRQR